MDHLSKQQIILLALLVSFVTSLMTGIVTVSLMDQAPTGVTRTITQVVRETVAGSVTPGTSSTASVAIAVSDQVADATAAITPSIVRLRESVSGRVAGLGVVVTPAGVIMTDKSLIDGMTAPEAVFPDGTSIPVAIVRFQIAGDIAFLAPTQVVPSNTKPASFASRVRLGSTVWSLSGTSTYVLSQGIVNEISPATSGAYSAIHTTISTAKTLAGSPLFDATGAIVGLQTGSLAGDGVATFYPVQEVRDAIPK